MLDVWRNHMIFGLSRVCSYGQATRDGCSVTHCTSSAPPVLCLLPLFTWACCPPAPASDCSNPQTRVSPTARLLKRNTCPCDGHEPEVPQLLVSMVNEEPTRCQSLYKQWPPFPHSSSGYLPCPACWLPLTVRVSLQTHLFRTC